jgi:hypothetical protein
VKAVHSAALEDEAHWLEWRRIKESTRLFQERERMGFGTSTSFICRLFIDETSGTGPYSVRQPFRI